MNWSYWPCQSHAFQPGQKTWFVWFLLVDSWISALPRPERPGRPQVMTSRSRASVLIGSVSFSCFEERELVQGNCRFSFSDHPAYSNSMSNRFSINLKLLPKLSGSLAIKDHPATESSGPAALRGRLCHSRCLFSSAEAGRFQAETNPLKCRKTQKDSCGGLLPKQVRL